MFKAYFLVSTNRISWNIVIQIKWITLNETKLSWFAVEDLVKVLMNLLRVGRVNWTNERQMETTGAKVALIICVQLVTEACDC